VRIAYASLHILSSLVVPSAPLTISFEILDLLGILVLSSAISRKWRFQTESENDTAGQRLWEKAVQLFMFEILPTALIIAGGLLRGTTHTYTIGTVLYKISCFVFLLLGFMFFAISRGRGNIENRDGSSNVYWWMSVLLLMRLAWAIFCIFKNQIYVHDLQGKDFVWHVFLAILPELLILVMFCFSMRNAKVDKTCPDTTVDASSGSFVGSNARRQMTSEDLAELEMRARLFEEETFRLYGGSAFHRSYSYVRS
jgi:hypothetical protein